MKIIGGLIALLLVFYFWQTNTNYLEYDCITDNSVKEETNILIFKKNLVFNFSKPNPLSLSCVETADDQTNYIQKHCLGDMLLTVDKETNKFAVRYTFLEEGSQGEDRGYCQATNFISRIGNTYEQYKTKLAVKELKGVVEG